MMQDVIVISPTNALAQIGQVANTYASQNVFTDYQQRKAANTIRRQRGDLELFARYLAQAGVLVSVDDLMTNPVSWHGITYGLVDGFVRWMLQEGYAIGSLNVRLSTIKTYAKLVAKAGVLPPSEYALIKMVEGYSHKAGRNVDQTREVIRKGEKKAEPVPITPEQAKALKTQPDTPQGRRDTLLMCLLLDHGLRCGEVEGLTVSSINLAEGTLTFYREKVDKIQIHQLTPETFRAALKYMQTDKPTGQLLMGSRKGGKLCGGMSERAITARVNVLGGAIGLVSVSAHDGRNYWATAAVRGGTDIKSLQDAGGWNSPAMPLRYVESNKIANQGVKLG